MLTSLVSPFGVYRGSTAKVPDFEERHTGVKASVPYRSVVEFLIIKPSFTFGFRRVWISVFDKARRYTGFRSLRISLQWISQRNVAKTNAHEVDQQRRSLRTRIDRSLELEWMKFNPVNKATDSGYLPPTYDRCASQRRKERKRGKRSFDDCAKLPLD